MSTDADERLPARRAALTVDGLPSTGVHAAHVTLAEARTLRARQAHPGRSTGEDGKHGLVTLREFAAFASAASASRGSPVGVHVEAKHPAWHAATLPHCARDAAAMVVSVAEALAAAGFGPAAAPWPSAPAFLQCFEPDALRAAAARAGGLLPPLVQLIGRAGQVVPGGRGNQTFAAVADDQGLTTVAAYAAAIGPPMDALLDTDIGKRAAATSLGVHAYTLRDDAVRARFSGDAAAEAAAALAAGATALFGDHPATAVAAVREARKCGGGVVAAA